MTQALATLDTYLADFQALDRGSAAGSPAWLGELRRQAMARFRELGFPVQRKGNEKWKYTSVAPIAEREFSHQIDAAPGVDAAALRRVAPHGEEWATAAFVNGRYSPQLSTADRLAEARFAGLTEAFRSDGELVRQHLGRYASFEDDGFAALNTAFVHDGAFIHLPRGLAAEAPLHLLYATPESDRPTVAYPRTLVVAEPQSRLTLIETYAGLASTRYFTDAVTEIVLGEGARVDHYKLLLESENAFHVGMTRAYQGKDSRFSSTLYARGSDIARNDILALLDAPGAECYLNGLYVTTEEQHIDNFINIDHAQPHGTSRLYYKGILDDESRAVFGGTVFVRPGADKTDAHQEDKNLVLSEKAEVASKPALEIYADDVKCGHGATAGAVAEDAVFYMLSRGLDLETATAFLIKGFASEILDTIEEEPLREFLEEITGHALRGVRYAAL